jgi:hypothetical protein
VGWWFVREVRVANADYYRRQADICMRLSLMSDDEETSGLLLNKAIELMGEADAADPPDRPPPNLHIVQQQQQIQPEDE